MEGGSGGWKFELKQLKQNIVTTIYCPEIKKYNN